MTHHVALGSRQSRGEGQSMSVVVAGRTDLGSLEPVIRRVGGWGGDERKERGWAVGEEGG